MNSQSKNQLIELQKEDISVFHGSGMRLEHLEPRQAYTFKDGVSVADDVPAIFASQLVDYAIFMALINRQTCPLGVKSSCDYEDDRLVFAACKNTLDQLNDSTRGYVHVFDRLNFTFLLQLSMRLLLQKNSLRSEKIKLASGQLRHRKPRCSSWRA